MRKKLLLLIFVPLILSLIVNSASCGTQNVYPSDDCYVDKSTANSNWDTVSLYVRDHDYLEFRSWLKFSVPESLTIESAELYVYLNALAYPDYTVINVYGSGNTTWTEETITWNNQPSYGSSLDSETVYATETWYSWDVTANVTSGEVSTFVLISNTYYPNAQFFDKEEGSNSPYLKLTLAEGEGEEEEEIDITILNFPSQLGEKLGISTWSAGMLLSALFLFPFNMILMFWKKGGFVALIFNFAILGIFTSFGWLPIWTVILVGVLVVAVSGLKMKSGL